MSSRILISLILFGSTLAATPAQAVPTMSFDQLVANLIKTQPWTVERTQVNLGVVLRHASSSANQVAYRVNNVKFNDKLTVSTMELRLDPQTGKAISFVFEIAPNSACTTIAHVLETYPGMRIESFPPIDSPYGMGYYAALQDWGKMAVGYRSNYRDCVASVELIQKKYLEPEAVVAAQPAPHTQFVQPVPPVQQVSAQPVTHTPVPAPTSASPVLATETMLVDDVARLLKLAQAEASGGRWFEANRIVWDGLNLLGDRYYSSQTIDDTGMNLMAALTEEMRNEMPKAVQMRISVLANRLEMYRYKASRQGR